jgi:signal transduction histidine kinase
MPSITPRERILVVESDSVISDLVARQALQSAGYQVQVVGDASTAIAQATQLAPDAVIANLELPGLSGKDLIVALNSQGIQTPVVVMGRKGSEADIIQAFRVGATDYLILPVREAEVINVVERVLKQVRERRERDRLAHQLQQTNQELQLRVSELTTIFGISKAVTSITNLSQLFDRILEGATKVGQADLGWLLLRDEARKAYVLVAHRNLPAPLGERLNQPWDDGISSLVAMSGEPLSIYGDSLKRFRIVTLGQSALIVPIKLQKQVAGLLIMMRRQPAPFSVSEQHLLEAFSDYAAIALNNARLFRAAEQRSQTLELAADSAHMDKCINREILQMARSELLPPLQNARQALNYLVKNPAAHWSADQHKALSALGDDLQLLRRVVEVISPLELPKAQFSGAVDLNELARQAIERAQACAQQNNLTLSVDLAPEPLLVNVDAMQISYALDGLLSNAMRFGKPGSKVILRIGKTAAGMVHGVVSDGGTGIDPKIASRIFDPSSSQREAARQRFGGVGIRLYLVKEIITNHQGRIWVESKFGQGADFHFTLPVAA